MAFCSHRYNKRRHIRTKRSYLSDIGGCDNEKKFIIGECKFRTELFDSSELKKLKEKMELQGEVYYYLFSLSGFTDTVIETAKIEKNLFLVDIKQIMNGVVGE